MRTRINLADFEDRASDLPARANGRLFADAAHGHLVQFYNSDPFLYDTMSRFVGEGLAGGEGVIVIATANHLDGLQARLVRNSFDVERARKLEQLTWLDADETLSKFMPDGRLDPALFVTTIAPVVERSGRARNGSVRAYGEMVDVLCSRGEHATALRLEHYWNQLIAARPLALLCGYSARNFSDAQQAQSFRHVCEAHSCVMPTESFSALLTEADAPQQEMGLLQQQTLALEVEVGRRTALELTLRRRNDERAHACHKLTKVARQLETSELESALRTKLIDELLEISRMLSKAGSESPWA